MVAMKCFLKQLPEVVSWLEYMESPLIVYVSPRAEFMGTKYNVHIHRYGTPDFGNIIVYIFKSINIDNKSF